MKSGIWPIDRLFNVPVLYWIVMNVIDVTPKIGLVADSVFPEPPLPNCPFPPFLP